MFDIGFSELVIIGVVGLLVIGPERLPGTIRTASMWLNRFKRGFNDIKREVQQELHNDSVMQELRKTGEQLKNQTDSLGQTIDSAKNALTESALPEQSSSEPPQTHAPTQATTQAATQPTAGQEQPSDKDSA